MLTEILQRFYVRDPTIKRHMAKAVSWRIVGTLDTVALGFLITGQFSMGLKIGALELFTKVLLYFLHERFWHKIPYGQPAVVRGQRIDLEDSSHLYRQNFAVTRVDRETLNGHGAFTIWLTGLSGAGKSSIASALDLWFHQQNIRSYIIDGDNTRLGINSDLNFSREGREENIRRVSEICRLFNDAGIIVISSFISPYRSDRERAKQIIGQKSFSEIHVAASLETCISRDRKGLYKKALNGEIRNFTGVNSPYESPVRPDLTIETDTQSVAESVEALKKWILAYKLNTAPVTEEA